MSEITRVGVDLTKHVIQVHAVDVNVGYGASSLNNPISAVSLDLPLDAHARMTGVGLVRVQQ